MAVKRGGDWYVSPTYTAAEYLAQGDLGADSDVPEGDFDDLDVEREPADDPEQAVIDLAESGDDLQLDEATSALAQPEWSVLRAYRQTIEGYIDEAQADGSLVDVQFDLDDSDLSVEELSGGARKVVIEGASGTAGWTDVDEGPQSREWDFDGRCLRITDPADGDGDSPEGSCIRTGSYLGRMFGLREAYAVVVPEEGGWVVSPVSTMMLYAKELAPRVTADAVFLLIGRPDLAEPVGDLPVGITVSAELNQAGFATYVLQSDGGEYAVSGGEDFDYFQIFDDDGEAVDYYSGAGAIELDAGEHRVVVRRQDYDGGREAEFTVARVAVEDMPTSGLTSGELSGTLTPERPVVDYRFQTSAPVRRSLSVESGSVDAYIIDPSGSEVCSTYEESCQLDGSTEYRLRVYSYGDDPSQDFTVLFQEATATIDGGSSVTDYVEEFESNYHSISVPSGVTVTVSVVSDDFDVDLDCYLTTGESCRNAAGDESITISGPYEGELEVFEYGSGAGGYTISLSG